MKLRATVVMALIAVSFSACSTSKTVEKSAHPLSETSQEVGFQSGLAAVPSDAVFLISSNGPLDQRVTEKAYDLFTFHLGEVEAAAKSSSGYTLFDRPSGEYVKELSSLMREKLESSGQGELGKAYDWKALGLSSTPEVLFYNVGIAQVARITLENPQIFAELLKGADQKFDKSYRREVDGVLVRILPESRSATRNRAAVVFAIVKNELLVGQVPAYYIENPDFWPLFLGDASNGGLGHEAVALPNPMPVTPNSVTGFFSFKGAVDQILNKQKNPSGKFFYDFFAHSKYKVTERCRSVLADYPIDKKDVSYLAVERDGLTSRVALQLPLDTTTSQALQKSMRPPVPENDESRKLLEGRTNFDVALNFNLFEFLNGMNRAVDDEIILASQCTGRFEYTAGSFGLLIAPMKSLLQLVDSSKFGYDAVNQMSFRNVFAAVNSSDPQTLLRGLSSLLGVANVPATIPDNSPIELQLPGNIKAPFPKPLQAILTPGRLSLFGGAPIRPYIDAEGKVASPSQLSQETPLFSYRYQLNSRFLNFGPGIVVRTKANLLKSGPLNLLFTIVEPK